MATQERDVRVKPGKLTFRRHFTEEGTHPFDQVDWEIRDAVIPNYKEGGNAFEQRGVEFPTSWSQNATNIVAQKYFRGPLGTPQRESSVRQMIGRVVDTISDWGIRDGYFASDQDARVFAEELTHLLVTQKAAFNSPVWFNVGAEPNPQCSACFILAVEDTMGSILNWYVEEGTIFKGGSGSGINLSPLRSSKEQLHGGGTASGPVSFMRGADASAGTIKSGGKTRRAAKMVVLNADHPDIRDFIWCKAIEEQKARVLRDAGYDMDLDGRDAYSMQYQNANNSVRVTDEFMRAYLEDRDWKLKAVTRDETLETVRARALMREMAQAAWECADPGLQYDTTINDWHTSPASGRINASNPCSEYLHLDNSACNLASLNLLKFMDEEGNFDLAGFKHAVEVVFTAQEIIVGNSSYPTEKIERNAKAFRQLGLGFANLGALLMARGVPYDSDGGRAWAGAITALMTGWAYRTSAKVAKEMGPFAGYAPNRDAMLRVMRKHRGAADRIDAELVPEGLLQAAKSAWDDAIALGERHGYRNAQATVLAPTGTISFLMDCDTTGIEPDLALVKNKKLVGGGTMQIVNQTVPRALRRLGYDEEQGQAIVAYIAEHNTVVDAPFLKPEHYAVFDCSMGDRAIHYMGHVKMMAAAQPFISGAISKCVTGETLLTTEDGLVRICDLRRGESPDSFRDHFMEVASLDGIRKTDAFYYGGVRPTREVVLRSGHRVIGTPNHMVLVAGQDQHEWRRLDELRPGDLVAVRYGVDMWAVVPPRFDGFSASVPYGSQRAVRLPAEMTEELAFLLGAYAAEGHITRSNWTIVVSNTSEAVLQRVAAAWRSEFGIEPRVIREAGKCPGVVVSSKTVVEFFEWLGCGHRASEKRIPDAILRSPKGMVLAFLRGLALDAYVALVGRSPKWAICVDSPRLLDDLQAVFTNLGVVHSRIEKANKSNGKSYGEVYASGDHAQALIRWIGFEEEDKQERAAAMLELSTGWSWADVIPGLSGKELYELIPRGRSGRNGYGERKYFTFLLDPRTRHISRRTLERVAAIPGVVLPEILQTVLRDGLHFSPVERVRDAGEREVFDLSVPETHVFVGNGIVNHNTVNMPEHVTVEEVEQLFVEGWKLGLKAVAIYRDNCKVAQPLSADKKKAPAELVEEAPPGQLPWSSKKRLPSVRPARTVSFRVGDAEGYITAGEYPDDGIGEIFLKVSKQGSTLSGLMDAFSIAVSVGLQYGVPLEDYISKFINMRFEPSGLTNDEDIRFASSLMDYIFRRLALEYLTPERRAELGIQTIGERLEYAKEYGNGTAGVPPAAPDSDEAASLTEGVPGAGPRPRLIDLEESRKQSPSPGARVLDAPLCYACGAKMQPAGSCYVCTGCGSTSGCS